MKSGELRILTKPKLKRWNKNSLLIYQIMNVFVLRTAIIYLIIYIYQKGTIYQNKRKDSKPTQYAYRYVLPQKSEGSSRNRAIIIIYV